MPVHVWVAALLLQLILFGTLPTWSHGSVIVQRIQDVPPSSGIQSADSPSNLSEQLGSSLSNQQGILGNPKEYFGTLVSSTITFFGGIGRDHSKPGASFSLAQANPSTGTGFSQLPPPGNPQTSNIAGPNQPNIQGQTPPPQSRNQTNVGLPPLPPALPYVRPRIEDRQLSTSAVPGPDGRVTARIPGLPDSSTASPSEDHPKNTLGEIPKVHAVRPQNPFDVFILDSFSKGATPSSQDQIVPPSNFVDQVRKDFQNLGEGIKDVFTKLIPIR
jgi:hypothetical protein